MSWFLSCYVELRSIKDGQDPNVLFERGNGLGAKSDPTLGVLLSAAIRRYWHGSKSTTQADNARRMIKRLGGKDTLSSEITPLVINNLIDLMRAKGSSDSTINRNMSALRRIFEAGIEDRIIGNAPKFPYFKEHTNRIRFFSDEEELLIVNYLRQCHPHWLDFITVMIDTGARNSELANCLSIDYQDGQLTFCRTKGDLNRTVPLTKRAEEIIKRRAKGGMRPIFEFYNKNTLATVWNTMKGRLGYAEDETFIPYVCRHTCASRLVQRGVDLRRVQVWMGHKRIETTLRYAHLAADSLLTARDVLE